MRPNKAQILLQAIDEYIEAKLADYDHVSGPRDDVDERLEKATNELFRRLIEIPTFRD